MFDLHRARIDNLARTLGELFDETPRPEPWAPAVDVIDHGDNLVLSIDLPGYRREDVVIEIDGRQLLLRGERPEPELADGETPVHRERRFGRFERSFTLGFGVDRERIAAELTNGVLTVQLPKAEPAKPRRIEVRAA
ncbi:MAG: Hsp20/alpha crystallin family protein [Armatimonadetes bacterium]|nr:Hsp20/alpha crystallin family protein [Armatimonadota bacterium]